MRCLRGVESFYFDAKMNFIHRHPFWGTVSDAFMFFWLCSFKLGQYLITCIVVWLMYLADYILCNA